MFGIDGLVQYARCLQLGVIAGQPCDDHDRDFTQMRVREQFVAHHASANQGQSQIEKHQIGRRHRVKNVSRG